MGVRTRRSMPLRHPPAWYLDPRHPDRVRRWDGRAWTGDVRPVPDWVRTLRLAPGPRDHLPRTTRALWATSGVFLLVGLVLFLAIRTGDVGAADRLHDGAFVERATARCAKAENDDIGPNRKPATGAAEARRIEALAVGWEDMVSDLRALPVATDDEPKVDRWLGAWERWTSLGHAYAAALRAGDDAEAQRVVRRSEAPKRAINHFAYVNGMNACVFN